LAVRNLTISSRPEMNWFRRTCRHARSRRDAGVRSVDRPRGVLGRRGRAVPRRRIDRRRRKLITAAVAERGGYQEVSTLKEPYRVEGKKTMGYEIAEQLDWKLPDVILCPTGGGVGLVGIWKALHEMTELGWIAGPVPRLVAVQAHGFAPIVRAFEQRASESKPFPDTRTVAFGINVPKALGDFIVLQAVRETDGIAIAVTDADLLAEQHHIAELEGVFICPEGGAFLAAAKQLRTSGWIRSGERVVVLNTGAGLKYPETVEVDVPTLAVDAPIPASR